MVSLREQSTPTILASIRSRPEEAADILRRANICLANYFDPDLDPETKAGVRQSFVTALADLPIWAVLRGFNAWERSMQRRPSPGEIRILAEREVKPLGEELARRRRATDEEKAAIEDRRRQRITPELATKIMDERGFTEDRLAAVMRRPMARSMDEAMEPVAQRPHSAETSEEHRAILAASRAANHLCNPGGA